MSEDSLVQKLLKAKMVGYADGVRDERERVVKLCVHFYNSWEKSGLEQASSAIKLVQEDITAGTRLQDFPKPKEDEQFAFKAFNKHNQKGA